MAEKTKKSLKIQQWQWAAAILMVIDALASAGGYFAALWLRYDCAYSKIPTEEFKAWLYFMPIYAALTILTCLLLRLYRSIWKFASLSELKRLIFAAVILGSLHALGITLIFHRMPLLYYFVGLLLQFVIMTFSRFSYRFLAAEKARLKKKDEASKKRVMVIGAGSAGQMVIRDLINNKDSVDIPVCVIDDDKNTWGRTIEGVKIVGGREDILLSVEKYKVDKIYVSIPGAPVEARRDILNICQETSCELKNLPGIHDIIDGKVTASNMKKVTIEDLLGRDPIKVDSEEAFRFLKDKVVLVTGGGGSIGSELCRQIARHSPKQLLIFDIYENNAHAIALEIKDKYPNLNMIALIGSVRDSGRINEVFRKYKPDVVFHAAAHKHVPLMEVSPCEAIKNNAVGTYKTAYAALANGCKRFVLISTDKAVNPTNIMGASKRLCEMIIQSFAAKVKDGSAKDMQPISLHDSIEPGREEPFWKIEGTPKTEFVAVRFGNVLGSNGSVVPRFKQQIEAGGPLTVTDPEIIRYFMTIPEAASLVLEAGAYAKGGEIFVLDMGSPVKIDTLARNMIKLSGYRPDIDIKIEYTGLRPGEKLYEEKLMSEEGLKSTKNKLIHIGKPIPFDVDTFLEQLKMLLSAAYDEKEDQIKDIVSQVVTTYHPAGAHGSHNKGEAYQKQLEQMKEKEESEKPASTPVTNPGV